MKVPFKTTLLAAALTSLVAVPVWAAGDEETTMPATGTEQMQQDPAGSGTPAPVPQDERLGAEDPQQMGVEDPQTASTDDPLQQLTPEELKKMEVVDPLGEKVGKIDTVVRSKADSNIQVVVSSGGVLGIGDHKVAVPIEKLGLSGDKIEISATEAELQQKTAYEPESFVELEPADRPLSEFSAFEPVPEEEVPIEEAPMSQPQEPIPEPDQPMTQPPEGSGGAY